MDFLTTPNTAKYAPPLEQTPYGKQTRAESRPSEKKEQRRLVDDGASVSSFGSTMGLLKQKFKSKEHRFCTRTRRRKDLSFPPWVSRLGIPAKLA